MSHNNTELSRGKWRTRVICEENTVRDNMRHSDTRKVHVHSCDEGGAAANADRRPCGSPGPRTDRGEGGRRRGLEIFIAQNSDLNVHASYKKYADISRREWRARDS